ncbi:MAG TPA: cytochrome c [Sphingomonadaceae bacterium]|nr:cytochrome c [Sphingomonadaceae bacterium]
MTLGIRPIAGLLPVLALATATAAQPPASAADAVSRGKAAFMNSGCWACHGYTGRGGIGPMTGPDIARDEITQDTLTFIVRHPIKLMPAYSEKVLSDAQIADIHSFLAAQPRSRSASDIPLLARDK